MTASNFRRMGAFLAAAVGLAPTMAAAQQSAPGHPQYGQIGLQPSVTPIMDSITVFHDGVLMWTISAIVLLVLALLVVVIVRFNARANPVPARFTHNTLIEVIWTVVPIVILVIIAIPSFGVLADQMTTPDGERRYLGANIFSFGDVEVPAPALTVKATGEQWFWNYEYVDQGLRFDQYILSDEDRQTQKPGQPRLLAVDNELVVPVNTTVRLLVTAAPTGVIHAFALPSFGIKVDAVPGRLNETWFNARETGIYYGQCSELCGKDHAFMPIAVRVVEQEEFDAWLTAFEGGDYTAANATLAAVE
ncbi:cytochrome c oxidase subunit II [Devosia nitrariae]|uniref:Cytochrome c oxidase subunit 2 n=1 Tax=Devosia nitrariae TaxID=2071872 RepID=A0ABQ5VZ79_9HYPH|nr:cytochrome c oxidase subunit 2 [Devosia nitrariae]